MTYERACELKEAFEALLEDGEVFYLSAALEGGGSFVGIACDEESIYSEEADQAYSSLRGHLVNYVLDGVKMTNFSGPRAEELEDTYTLASLAYECTQEALR